MSFLTYYTPMEWFALTLAINVILLWVYVFVLKMRHEALVSHMGDVVSSLNVLDRTGADIMRRHNRELAVVREHVIQLQEHTLQHRRQLASNAVTPEPLPPGVIELGGRVRTDDRPTAYDKIMEDDE